MAVTQTEIRVKGEAVSVPSLYVDGRTLIIAGTWLKKAAIQDEELAQGDPVPDPASFLAQLKEKELRADIFTFAQKLPDTKPKFPYHLEWDNLAVIPITSFSDWWDNKVEPSVRRAVRKSAKNGVTVKPAALDHAFVQGIVNINNESAIRQGRPFWHYRKSFDAVMLENSTYPANTFFLGAYYEEQLIGYMRITCAGTVANIIQSLSMMKHFDKRPGNALVAKAVEVCAERGMSHLVYCNYVYNDPNSSLTEFKRRNGFQKVLLPRYFIPLTMKGRVALSLGLHQGLVKLIPQFLIGYLLRIRTRWYALKVSKSASREDQ